VAIQLVPLSPFFLDIGHQDPHVLSEFSLFARRFEVPYFSMDVETATTHIVSHPRDNIYQLITPYLHQPRDVPLTYVIVLKHQGQLLPPTCVVADLLSPHQNRVDIEYSIELQRPATPPPLCPSCQLELEPRGPTNQQAFSAAVKTCCGCATPTTTPLVSRWYCRLCPSITLCYDCQPGPSLAPTCRQCSQLFLYKLRGRANRCERCKTEVIPEWVARYTCLHHSNTTYCPSCLPLGVAPVKIPPLLSCILDAQRSDQLFAAITSNLAKISSSSSSTSNGANFLWAEWSAFLSPLLAIRRFQELIFENLDSRATVGKLLDGILPVFETGYPITAVLSEVKVLFTQDNHMEVRNFISQHHLIESSLASLGFLTAYPCLQDSPIVLNDAIRSELQRIQSTPAAAVTEGLPQAQNPGRNFYWVAGRELTAAEQASSSWSPLEYATAQRLRLSHASVHLDFLSAFLTFDQARLPELENSSSLLQLIQRSSLPVVLETFLRNDSVSDLVRLADFYSSLFSFIAAVARHSWLWPLLPRKLYPLLERFEQLTVIVSRETERVARLYPNQLEITEEQKLTTQIRDLLELLRQTVYLKQAQKSHKPKKPASSTLAARYVTALKGLQFAEADLLSDESLRQAVANRAAPSLAALRRIVAELGNFSTGLPLHVASSCFVRVDSSRLDVMSVLITGPDRTPYAGGCFIFDIRIPANFPSSPPSIELVNKPTAVIHPNINSLGAVCMNLLQTGRDSEWSEHSSSILQILITIQALIFVPEPVFATPAQANRANTPEGAAESKRFNQNTQRLITQAAILQPLRQPCRGFAEVINQHFLIKGDTILSQLRSWAADSPSSFESTWTTAIADFESLLSGLRATDHHTPVASSSS
jgi:ubiquitin-protein ligase